MKTILIPMEFFSKLQDFLKFLSSSEKDGMVECEVKDLKKLKKSILDLNIFLDFERQGRELLIDPKLLEESLKYNQISEIKSEKKREEDMKKEFLLKESKKAMKKLGFHEYIFIELYFLKNRTLSEIAEFFDLSKSTVKNLRNKGIKKLRSFLKIT